MKTCYEVEPDASRHCGTCHGDNMWDEDLSLECVLDNGNLAELCCKVAQQMGAKET